MYTYIKGIYQGTEDDKIIIENGGIGYEICAPNSVLAMLPEKGEMLKLYVHEVIREDAHELVGFTEKEQKKIYMKRLNISGIGPKAALAILSVLSPRDIVRAVAEIVDVDRHLACLSRVEDSRPVEVPRISGTLGMVDDFGIASADFKPVEGSQIAVVTERRVHS